MDPTKPWRELGGDVSGGAAAPRAVLAAAHDQLRSIHPEIAAIPAPIGSAFMQWGADPLEIGWTFWSAGARSDEVMAAAIQPDPDLALYLCGETFSRTQSWAEGALETADAVVERLAGGPPTRPA